MFGGNAARCAAAWSPPRYLISKPHGRADMRLAMADAWYLISPGRSCIAPAIPVDIRISTPRCLAGERQHVALLKQGVGGQWPGTT